MSKEEYGEFHKYLAILIYEYSKLLMSETLSSTSRKDCKRILKCLYEVQKICILGDKE